MFKKIFLLFFILTSFPLCTYGLEKTIHLATLDWEPYIGQKLPNQGLVAEIVTEALKVKGYKLYLDYLPWARAVNEAAKGVQNIDGLMPEYYSQTRLQHFIFSDPFFSGPVGFLIRTEDKNKIQFKIDSKDLNLTYENMKDLKFGVVRGYINEEKFDANKSLKKIESVDDATNIDNLASKKVDTIFIDKYVASYISHGSPSFIFLHPPILDLPLYIAWSKKAEHSSEKIQDFNEGLKKIRADGTLNRIINKYPEFR